MAQVALEEQVGRRGEAHGGAGVAVAHLLDRVHGQAHARVDSAVVEVGPSRLERRSRGRAHRRLTSRSV